MGSGFPQAAIAGMVLGFVVLIIVVCYGTARSKQAWEERTWLEIESSHNAQDMEGVDRYHHRVPPLYRPDDYQSTESNASFETIQWSRPERAHVITDRLQRKVSRLIPLIKPRSREPDIEMGPVPKPAHLRPSDLQNLKKLHNHGNTNLLRLNQKASSPDTRRHHYHALGSEYSSSSKPVLPQRMHHSFLPPLIIPSLTGSSVQQVSRLQPIAAKDLAYGSRKTWDEVSISRSAREREHNDVWPSPDSRWRLTPDLRNLLLDLIMEERWMNPCELAHDFIMTWRRATIFGLSAITTSPSNSSPIGAYRKTWRSKKRETQALLWPSPSFIPISPVPKRRRRAFWSR